MIIAAIVISTLKQEPTQFVWTKEIRPGIVYKQHVDLTTPLIVNSLTLKYPQEGIRLEPAIPNEKLKLGNFSAAMAPVNQMALKSGAFAAINADFFFQGDPLGMLMINGNLLSEPFVPRAVLAWNSNQIQIDHPTWRASLAFPDNSDIKISGINRMAGDSDLVLFTPGAEKAISRYPSTMFVFSGELPAIGKSSKLKFQRVVSDTTEQIISPGELVICATDNRLRAMSYFAELNIESTVNLKIDGSLDWSIFPFAISGGPRLVRQKIAIKDFHAEKFDNTFINNRHPRTGVGLKSNGELVFVVVDGRSTISRGMNLSEFADWFVKLGCDEAINLDGGGSSTFFLGGMVLNRPSDGQERLVGNAILLFAPPGLAAVGSVKIAANLTELKPGDVTTLRVFDQSNRQIPIDELLWVCEGRACWIDQGGKLRAIEPGTSTIKVSYRGLEAKLVVTVMRKGT